jgi:hypothetical protein
VIMIGCRKGGAGIDLLEIDPDRRVAAADA